MHSVRWDEIILDAELWIEQKRDASVVEWIEYVVRADLLLEIKLLYVPRQGVRAESPPRHRMGRSAQAEKVAQLVQRPLLPHEPGRNEARIGRGPTEFRQEEAIAGHSQYGPVYRAVALIANDVFSALDRSHAVYIAVYVDAFPARQKLVSEHVREESKASFPLVANDLAPIEDPSRIDKLDAGWKIPDAIVGMEPGSVTGPNE